MADYLGELQSVDLSNVSLADVLKEASQYIRQRTWNGRGSPKPGDISPEDVLVSLGEEFGYWHVTIYYREYTSG